MKYDFYITGTIGEQFDWWTGQHGTTSDMVREFLDRHKNEEVNIAVSSPGGYLSDGLTIGEMIAAHGKCNMAIIGMTASAATVLCMKAKSVKIARGSLILIHNCSQYVYGGGISDKRKIDAYIERLNSTRHELDTLDKAVADIYASRNGRTIDENLAMMDKEQWMTAKDAVDFGIVDGILDDDDSKAQTKAIQNVYASYDGVEERYGLPQLPELDSPTAKMPKGILARLKSIFKSDNHNQNPLTTMKKLILSFVCAALAVQHIDVGEDGKATLTEDQLNALDSSLKEKNERISALETEKQSADEAKAALERQLADLQKEFNDFKAAAGDDTTRMPIAATVSESPATSNEMFNQIKDIL